MADKIIIKEIEPAIQKKISSSLGGWNYLGSSFKFEKFGLGNTPPRITGIKVYEKNVCGDEIMMDLDLEFASNELDIEVSLIQSVKISDFSFRGTLRLVLKPLLTEKPLIGGIEIYFLQNPKIDYNLESWIPGRYKKTYFC